MKKSDREKIYNKYDGHCAYCGKKIDYSDMQVDHFYPLQGYRLSDDPRQKMDNLMPSCRRCNHYKRAWHPDFFRQLLKKLNKKLSDQYLYKVAIDYGLIEIKEWDGIFYYEKFNQSGE